MVHRKDPALEKILQNITRSFVSTVAHPPDPAAEALGRRLAIHCWKSSSPSEKVFPALTQANLHISVPIAFFKTYGEHIEQNPDKDVSFLKSWTFRLEEQLVSEESGNSSRAVLEECLAALAMSINSDNQVIELYRRLKLSSSRQCLWQACLVRDLWKPLLIAILLNLTNNISEQLFCVRSTLRYIWTMVDAEPTRAFDAVDFFVGCLERLVTSFSNHPPALRLLLDMAASSLLDIVEIGQILVAEDARRLDKSTRIILKDILFPLHIHGLSSRQFGILCEALLPLARGLTLDVVAAFRLSVLSMLVQEPIRAILGVVVCDDPNSAGLIKSLGLMQGDLDLQKFAPLQDDQETTEFSVLRSLRFADDPLVLSLLGSTHFEGVKDSSILQVTALSFGLIALENERYRDQAGQFLVKITDECPHLSRTILPVILNRVENQKDPTRLATDFEFLSNFVKDPLCAQMIWKLMDQVLSDPHAPSSVRIILTRILPKFVQQNKRMYRRVVDVVGSALTGSPELRLAAAATLCELAEMDLIRDVSDVIGWIQTLLTEERTDPLQHLLVHYACKCLHALVRSEELEFSVVVQVVGKKLVNMNSTEIMKLPLVIVEAIVLLLGDGDCDTRDSDEEPEPGTSVSPQVSTAVDTLISIGLELIELSPEEMDTAECEALKRVRQNLFAALSCYSLEMLGVDEEGVQAVVKTANVDADENPGKVPPSGVRYSNLVKVVLDGLGTDEHFAQESDQDGPTPIVRLARQLLILEEESLGVTLWQKQGRRANKLGNQPSRALLAPLPRKSTVAQAVADRTSMAASITRMVSLDNADLFLLRDNADASIESPDAIFLSFAIQGYLNVAARLCSSANIEIGEVLDEIGSWFEVFVSADAMYLSLSSLSVYIPPDLREDTEGSKPYVEEIFDVVFRAYKDTKFEKEDVSKISLGLIGTSAYRRGAMEALDNVISLLEQSVRGYGGQQDFGAYYGLALICQALGAHEQPSVEQSEVETRLCRIAGFLLGELLSCFDDSDNYFAELATCVSSGSLTTDLLENISEIERGSVALLMTKHVVARYLFISCSLSLPALGRTGDKLLVAVLYAIDTLEWGSGKGLTLPPILQACEERKLLRVDELDKIYSSYATMFDSRMDSDEADIVGDGLDDIFYAVNRTANRPTPHIVRELLVGNQELFDDDGCVLSLIAAVAKVCTFPCLGAESFAFSASLDASAVVGDVKSIVQIVEGAANSDDDGKYSSMALILLGILASLKDTKEIPAVSELMPKDKEEDTDAAVPPVGDSTGSIDFVKLPYPQTATSLFGILDILESTSGRTPIADQEFKLPHPVLESLHVLSLPKEFATTFLAPLLTSPYPPTTKTCIDMLLSQITGRRKAAMDGRDFFVLASQLMQASSSDGVINYFGDTTNYRSFLEGMAAFGTKLPFDSLLESINAAWKGCLSLDVDTLTTVCSFLVGFRGILSSTALSPKLTNSLRQVLRTQIFADISEMGIMDTTKLLGEERNSVICLFTQCLKEIPLSELDESGFFDLEQNPSLEAQSFRVHSTLAIISQGSIFTDVRPSLELNKVTAWLSSHLSSSDGQQADTIRRLVCSYSRTCSILRTTENADQLAALFEVLLLTNGHQRGLELLAVFMAFWCPSRGSDANLSLSFLLNLNTPHEANLPPSSLEQYFQILVHDMTCNIGLFCRREKTSAVVFNLLHRLHSKWTSKKVSETTLSSIDEALCHCRSGLANEDSYVLHVAKNLQT